MSHLESVQTAPEGDLTVLGEAPVLVIASPARAAANLHPQVLSRHFQELIVLAKTMHHRLSAVLIPPIMAAWQIIAQDVLITNSTQIIN